MRAVGIAVILIGLMVFVMPAYSHFIPPLRNVAPGDLRLWGAMTLGAGAIIFALGRRSDG